MGALVGRLLEHWTVSPTAPVLLFHDGRVLLRRVASRWDACDARDVHGVTERTRRVAGGVRVCRLLRIPPFALPHHVEAMCWATRDELARMDDVAPRLEALRTRHDAWWG